MNHELVKMDDMTYSREMFEAKSSPVIPFFIGMLLLIIIIGGIGCYFGEIDIVVKSNGMIKPNEKVTRVTNKVLGKVVAAHYTAGQKVKQGELLYALQLDGINHKRKWAVNELQKEKAEHAELIKMKNTIAKAQARPITLEKQDAFNYALQDQNTDKQRFVIQQQQLTTQISRLTNTLQQLKMLQQSMITGKNGFTNKNKYYYQYEQFAVKQRQLMLKLEQAHENFLELVRSGKEAEKEKKVIEESSLNVHNYTNEVYLQVIQEIKQSEQQLADQSQELNKLYVEFNYLIQQKAASCKDWEEKLNEMEQSMREREVRAPVGGIVHVSKEMNKGELLQTGEEILTIIPENDGEFIIDMAVSNQDIARIQVGDVIKCDVTALPAQNYGYLTGHITIISGDAIIDPQSGASYYNVRACLLTKPLYNEQGKQVYIKNGMLAEVHIRTHREKILSYWLHKLDLQSQ